MACWTVLGVLAAYTMISQALFVRTVPDAQRGQAVGLASAGLQTVQGLGVLAAGFLADLSSPSSAVGLMGVAGAFTAVAAGLRWKGTGLNDDRKMRTTSEVRWSRMNLSRAWAKRPEVQPA